MMFDALLDSLDEHQVKVLALNMFEEQMDNMFDGQNTEFKLFMISGYLSTLLKDENDMDKYCQKFHEIREMLKD